MSDPMPLARHPILAALAEVVPGLAKALGSGSEVVLHELSHPESSVVAIAGDITGRKVGAPLTDLVLRLLRQGRVFEDPINYPSRTPDGRPLRSSTVFVRDESGEVIGCLCINFELTRWMVAKHLIEGYCRTESLRDQAGETFSPDVEGLLETGIQEIAAREGIPVPMMKKEHKLRVVRALDDQGLFLIKGAVDDVARFLDVSRYTVYNYLQETRSHKNSTLDESAA
jgi:predicted transcriptional regulator YheO